MATDDKDKTSREPFVSQADRPDLRLNPDAPLSELRVRDLATILRLGTRKDFWDGKDFLKEDFDGVIKWKDKEVEKGKEVKDGKEKSEKSEKSEKREKTEIKEFKAEKVEIDGVFEVGQRPDPRIEQVIEALSGLTKRVAELTDQIEELKKGRKG
jgi:hypothetical protein